MAAPWFWIVAGINGAGKSTLTRRGPLIRRLGQLPVLNPDELTERILL